MERRLAAIMATDVVGYSRLMESDEAATLAVLKTHREEVIDTAIDHHHGRIVKLMGDGALVEFPSVVEAVQCALDIQTGLGARNAAVPEDRRFEIRIGVNLGDVLIDGDDLYGDGVNLAARLQQLAPPNGIFVSDLVRQSVDGKLNAAFADLGAREVKNISRPVHVFQVVPAGTSPRPGPAAPGARHFGRHWALGIGAAALLALSGLVAWAMLGAGQPGAPGAACTDHLGLPVAAEKCAGSGEE